MQLEELRRKLKEPPVKPECENRRDAAVLIALTADSYNLSHVESGLQKELSVLFEVRAKNLAVQPGEICLPGGGIEQGETPEQAAVRETSEELLTEASRVDIIGKLPKMVTPRGGNLYPVIGVLSDYEGTYSTDEVDHVFAVPLSFFLENEPACYEVGMETRPGEDFPYDLIPEGRSYPWARRTRKIYFYQYGDNVIWGVTAGVIRAFARRLLQ